MARIAAHGARSPRVIGLPVVCYALQVSPCNAINGSESPKYARGGRAAAGTDRRSRPRAGVLRADDHRAAPATAQGLRCRQEAVPGQELDSRHGADLTRRPDVLLVG